MTRNAHAMRKRTRHESEAQCGEIQLPACLVQALIGDALRKRGKSGFGLPGSERSAEKGCVYHENAE